MTEEKKLKNIVGVRLREEGGKIYFFDPNNIELKKNDHVIVDTQLGPEYGTVVISKRELSDEQIVHPLKNRCHSDSGFFSYYMRDYKPLSRLFLLRVRFFNGLNAGAIVFGKLP